MIVVFFFFFFSVAKVPQRRDGPKQQEKAVCYPALVFQLIILTVITECWNFRYSVRLRAAVRHRHRRYLQHS